MRIKPPPTEFQRLLLDVTPDLGISSNGAARTHYGRTVERVAQELLGLIDIENSGNYDLVYDAFGFGKFCEIKSVHATGAVPLYEWRRKKDRDSGTEPVYILVLHRVRGERSLAGVRCELARTLEKILILPFSEIDRLAPAFPLRQLVKEEIGSRMGYKRKGYCKGYRNVSVKSLLELPFRDPVVKTASWHGIEFRAPVFQHKEEEHFRL